MEDQGNAGLPAALAPQTLSRSESPAGGQVPMRRRTFITLLGGAAAWPLAARAQQGERTRRIGVLMSLSKDDPEDEQRRAVLQQSLQQLGWSEGRNLHIEYRWFAGEPVRAPAMAKELVAL